MRRDPEETFKSFARIGWRESNEAGRKETYQRMAEIDYSDYRDSPERVAAVLSELSGLTISVADLGFTDHYSSSTLRGRFRVMVEKSLKAIPLPVRNAIRSLVPKSVLQRLFPGR